MKLPLQLKKKPITINPIGPTTLVSMFDLHNEESAPHSQGSSTWCGGYKEVYYWTRIALLDHAVWQVF
jgi:hypothetical protein